MSVVDSIKTGVLARLASIYDIWCILMAVPFGDRRAHHDVAVGQLMH